MQINKDPFSITHTSAVFEPVFNECIRLLRWKTWSCNQFARLFLNWIHLICIVEKPA
jgi:hypothetical protein